MAKRNRPASEYAAVPKGAVNLSYETGTRELTELNISVAGISKDNYQPTNRNGEKTMRGYGAATKGRKISGKMG